MSDVENPATATGSEAQASQANASVVSDKKQLSTLDQLIEMVNLFGKAVTNNDEVNCLRRLIQKHRAAADKGNLRAQTKIGCYKDDLKDKMFDIALNFGVSVFLTTGGFVVTGSAIGSMAICEGAMLCASAVVTATGTLVVIMGTITIALGVWTFAKAVYDLLTC